MFPDIQLNPMLNAHQNTPQYPHNAGTTSVETGTSWIENLFKKWFSSGLTDSELQANAFTQQMQHQSMEFNSSEATRQMEFQAKQAQDARAWQEQMYDKYYSPSAQVQQYKDAGLNPALLYGRGASTPSMPSTTSPSGALGQVSGGSSVTPSYHNMFDSLYALAQLSSQLRVSNSLADKYMSEAVGQNIQNRFSPRALEQNLEKGVVEIANLKAGVNQILANTGLISEQKLSESTRRALYSAQKVLANTQQTSISLDNFQKRWENSYIHDFGFRPDDSLLKNMFHMLTKLIDKYFGPPFGDEYPGARW